jgi:parallel beta-helix repeat protein
MKANRLSLNLILGVLTALALVPFPASAQGPTNINKCTTISEPGAYELTRNLDATGDCLVIAADFVTIDLKGFRIAGNGSGRGITDANVAHFGIAIRNGTITNFQSGIELFGGAGSTNSEIEQIRAVNNVGGFGILVRDNSIVSGNTATGNTTAGIAVGDNSIVSGNNASRNKATGINVGIGSTISGNTASQNGGIGIFLSCPSSVVGNTAFDNATNIQDPGGCTRANNSPAP